MTGELIIDIPHEEPHKCRPPGDLPLTKYGAFGGQTPITYTREHVDGSLWRCHCGQHWTVKGRTWEPISDRRARHIIRRHQRE